MYKTIALGVALYLTTTLGAWMADDYYDEKAVEWFEAEQEECFEKRWAKGPDAMPTDLAIWMACWRVIDNVSPAVSEILAPAPKMRSKESVKKVSEQKFYWDSWAGIIIKVDPEVQE